MKLYIGMDNGVTSGGIAFISKKVTFEKFPTKRCRNYTRDESFLNRVDVPALKLVLSKEILNHAPSDVMVGIERPMINSRRFQASLSAIRCLESVLITLEALSLDPVFIDSKDWQKTLLPSSTKGTEALKKASKEVGTRLYPQFAKFFKKDADSMLIAEYLMRTDNKEL